MTTTRTGRLVRRGYDWTDDRLAVSRSGRKWLNYVFPDHWSFLFGEIALYSFLALVITGIFLSLHFVPSMRPVVYHGPYKPLDGQRMEQAYATAVQISFQVRAGLLMRQIHHWAALVFVGAIVVHMFRIVLTGAYRRPRELNFHLGATMLLLAVLNGYLGYSMPGDLLSGTGVRIGYSILEAVPIVGSQLCYLIFGGRYPGTIFEQRFFFLHVFVVPILLFGMIGAHLAMIIRAHHTQFPGRGAREDNVVGTPMWPAYAAKSVGFMFLIFGVLALMGALFTIDPIWQYGPYVAYKVSDAAQPDWYIGWLEGALRLWPSWQTNLPGHMIPVAFFPSILLPGLTWVLFYLYPHLEERLTHDHAPHNLLERPRDHPVRTGFATGLFTFYAVLTVAAGDDVLAHWLHVPIEDAVWYFRVAVLVLPAIVFLVTYRICVELRHAPPASIVDHDAVVYRRRDGSYATARRVELVGASDEERPHPLGS